jgi:hypothetical protein
VWVPTLVDVETTLMLFLSVHSRTSQLSTSQSDLVRGSSELIMVKVKLGNTVYFAKLAWCLLARFTLFPSVCDSTCCVVV